MRVTSATERPSRSMAVTTTVSPARASSSIAASPGRAVLAEPESRGESVHSDFFAALRFGYRISLTYVVTRYGTANVDWQGSNGATG